MEKFFYLLATFLLSVQCETYFELIKGADFANNADAGKTLFGKKFFECDRHIECKYVVKMLGSKDLKIVPEKHVLDSPGHFAKIWKKIEIGWFLC